MSIEICKECGHKVDTDFNVEHFVECDELGRELEVKE